MLTFSPNGHGMGVYEEMRVHAVQACTHLRMLALVQPVADFHRLTRRETRERWRHHGSTDTVCTIGLRTGAVCVCAGRAEQQAAGPTVSRHKKRTLPAFFALPSGTASAMSSPHLSAFSLHLSSPMEWAWQAVQDRAFSLNRGCWSA
jgi:hypothetical protein